MSKKNMSPGYHPGSNPPAPPVPHAPRHPYYPYGAYPPPPNSHNPHGGPHPGPHPGPPPHGQPSPYSMPMGAAGGSQQYPSNGQQPKQGSSNSNPSSPSQDGSGSKSSSKPQQLHYSYPPPPYFPPPTHPYPTDGWGARADHNPHAPPPYHHPHHWAPHARYGGPIPPPPPHPPHSHDGRSPYWGGTAVISGAPGGQPDMYETPPGSAGPAVPVGSGNHVDARLPPPSHAGPTSGQSTSDRFNNDVDGREGATSPSQIENSHRDEVQHMGCTCKKTKCLKLYCQCFGVKIYCGVNCRCLNCHNNRKHEKQRKEAMRNILSRNPSAFDTKFKKTGEQSQTATPTAAAVAASEAARALALAHKLGCKCRKSACMKKYCECYAGNVKCSANCRCMGCKNMGTGFELREVGPPLDSHAAQYSVPPHPHLPPVMGPPPARQSEAPWLAAQNLTFLKRGSPASEQKKKISLESTSGELASMPSLASSSDATSPGDGVLSKKSSVEEKTPEKEDSGANALLMAAVAMTEFGQSPPPKQHEMEKNKNAQSGSSKEKGKDTMSSPSSLATAKQSNVEKSTSGEENISSSPAPPFKRALNFNDAAPVQTQKKAKTEEKE